MSFFQKWTNKRNWQHWVHETQHEDKQNKNTTQYVFVANTYWSIAVEILRSSPRSGWPYRNIHVSNDNEYFIFFVHLFLSSITAHTFTGLDCATLGTRDTKRRQTKQKHHTICVWQHYMNTNTTNVNQTWTLIQTSYIPPLFYFLP
jgi:hypothetical protein